MPIPDDKRSIAHPAHDAAATGPRGPRWTLRALELGRIASLLESARLRVLSEAVRTRSIERGVRIPGPLAPASAPDAIEPPPSPTIDAESFIAGRLDGPPRRPSPESPEDFDPRREVPWWRSRPPSGP